MALGIATRIPVAESTIEFLSLRPIDLRTKALILSCGLCGPIFGWSFGVFRGWPNLAAALAGLVVGTALLLAGLDARPSITLAIMSGLQAATVSLFVQLLVSDRRDAALALLVCLGLGAVAFLPILDAAPGFIGALVPTFWVGDILVAEQLGQESRSAGMVGLCLHLLPLCMVLGLACYEMD